MKKLTFVLLLMIYALPIFSQMSVKSFELLPFDLDASTNYPKKDWNGETCAIIKVFTTQTGFSFDVGQIGVVEVDRNSELHPAEIWVYVPPKAMKIKIAHPQLGHLSNASSDGYYWFPSGRVKGGCCYKLDLVSGTVKTVVEETKVKAGYLILESEPTGAEVYFEENGEEKYKGNTIYQQRLPYGRYNFRLKKDKYHDEVGVAVIDSSKRRLVIPLQPAFGAIELVSEPAGARVILDGGETGKVTPCRLDEVLSGSHNVKLILDKYAPVSRTITMTDGSVVKENVLLEARFATIEVTSLPNAVIKINGEEKGRTSVKMELLEGVYDIDAVLDGHKSAAKQIEVIAGHNQSVDLRPVPIYGSLGIMSTPIDAFITIDGKDCGTTPLMIDELLIGEHDVKLSKEGYAAKTCHVKIGEGETVSINEVLEKEADNTTVNAEKTAGDDELTPRWSWRVNDRLKKVLSKLISNMVKVPGGTFRMKYSDVTLTDYYIGKYEVTQEEWMAVMGNNPSYFRGANLPVERVSWNDCIRFVKVLNALTGLNFVLPTEAQWEYAARGGADSNKYKYSGANDAKSVAWVFENSNGRTHNVGTKLPNQLGLYDMTGNVQEWCSDYYSELNVQDKKTNPLGPDKGHKRVIRGGSWGDLISDSNLLNRKQDAPDVKQTNYTGFRIALMVANE